MKILDPRPWWLALDLPLLASAAAVAAFCWLALVSAACGHWPPDGMALRQAAYIAVGLVVMVVVSRLDYRRLGKLAWPFYLLCLCLLAAVLVPGLGHSARGACRWLSMGPLGTLEPSELAKLSIVFLLAWHLGRRLDGGSRFRPLWMFQALALAAVPFALIARQPDLGTALVILGIAFIMLLAAGTSPIHLAGLAVAGLGAMPMVLKDYQRQRLFVFLNPAIDPRGSGYNVLQSLTAIGSGGAWGVGLFHGHLSHYGFVPENHTDFIATVVGEEAGLAGMLALLALFLLLLLALLRIALKARDSLGGLLATGVGAMIGFQVVVNLGMCLGLLPVVGLPLPLASYGGSAMLADFAALGLAASVSRVSRESQFDPFV